MKWFATIAALTLVVALGAGSAAAAGKNKIAKAAKADRAGKRDHAGVAGVVSSVAGTNITVQTRGKKGTEIVIATDETTKFEGVKTVADVKAGMHVTATPITGTAQKVIVQPGHEGKGAGKAAKKAKDV